MNNGKSLGQRYRDTILKRNRLKEEGFELLIKWSCELKADLLKNSDLKQYLDEINIIEPVNIRDSYYGGRTNALTLYRKFGEDEKGYYVDFCSLYPDVLKYQKYPIGHPQKIIDNFKPLEYIICDNTNKCEYRNCNRFHVKFPYFGIVKAKFLAPNDLIHPVLPVHCNGKLKFPLCYNCAVLDNTETCNCNSEKRSFIQTYCTNKVEVALNMGYKIIKIYEVLHWEFFDMYDPVEQKGGLITDYINTFLHIKQESSGLPKDIPSENIEQYILQYEKHEGITMLRENI